MRIRFLNNKIFLVLRIWILAGIVLAGTSFVSAEMEMTEMLGPRQTEAVVERVIQTNLVVLDSGEKIKLIGLKDPDPRAGYRKKKRDENGFVIPDPDKPFLSVEETALQFVRDLLSGERIRIEFDIQPKDEQGYTLAYIFLKKDDLFVNAEIIRQGFAEMQLKLPNRKYDAVLRDAYREARAEQRGFLSQ